MRRLVLILLIGALVAVGIPRTVATASTGHPEFRGLAGVHANTKRMASSSQQRVQDIAGTCVIPQASLNQLVELGDPAGGVREEVPGTTLILWDVIVDWGDGSATSYHNQTEISHVYAGPGAYSVHLQGSGLIGPIGGPFDTCFDNFTFTVTVLELPALSVADTSIAEGDQATTSAAVQIRLSRASYRTVTVTYGTNDGSARAPVDYKQSTAKITFAPGEVIQTIHLQIIADLVVEEDESFNITLSSPGDAVVARGDATVEILNDDTPPKAEFATVVSPGGVVEFDASNSTSGSGGAPIVGYEWDFGDGQQKSETSESTDHSFSDPKKYDVSLVVVDSAGNRSDKYSVAVDTCAPDRPATTGVQYADLVRCVEAAFPSAPSREVLSMLRQIYFGSASWSQRRDSNWDNIINCRIAGPDPTAVISPKLHRALLDAKSTVSGTEVSHLFTGAEALACPTDTVEFPPVRSVPANLWTVNMPNYLIATWGGDVGSAAGRRAFEQSDGSTAPWTRYLGPSGIRASYNDLSGDVDSLVFSYAANGRSCSDSPRTPLSWAVPSVSQSLRGYFSPTPNALSSYRISRVSCFVDIMGVRSPASSNNFVSRFSPSVEDFALSYFLAQSGGSSIVLPDNRRLVRVASGEGTRLFYEWLLTQP